MRQTEQLIAAALEAERVGRLDSAERLLREAIALDDRCLIARSHLGTMLLRKGDKAAAFSILNRVVEEQPEDVEALIALSTVHGEEGRISDALKLARRAAEQAPEYAPAQAHLGRCLLAAREIPNAIACLTRAIELDPKLADAHYNLGRSLSLAGRITEAAAEMEKAAQLSPTTLHLIGFGELASIEGRPGTAIECAQASLRIDPGSVEAHLLLSRALIDMRQRDEAMAHLESAIHLGAEKTKLTYVAQNQLALGLLEDAKKNFLLVLERQPRNVQAFRSLMYTKRAKEEDRPLLEQMLKLPETYSMSLPELADWHYGLGKALDDLGEFEEAMSHYDKANEAAREIKTGGRPFDFEAYEARVDRLIKRFDTLSKETGRLKRCESDLPILIVGMMRSGTTLIEQIISSHPDAASGGEQHYWSNNDDELLKGGPDSLARLGGAYADYLHSIDPKAKRVTDKLPGNYMFASVVHLSLPNARIVHVRREPVATCLSIWSNFYRFTPAGSHDKAAMVFVYGQYLRLAEHMRQVILPANLLEIDYETLVRKPAPEIRRLVDFCGLEWNQACLSPEKNKGIITTASHAQARQAINENSVDRWRRFEPWLGEFSKLQTLETTGEKR